MADDSERIPEAIQFAANHINVSSPSPVTASQFLDALAGAPASSPVARAAAAWLDEADPAELADAVASGAVTFATLAQRAKEILPTCHPNRVYLDQFAA